MNLLIINCRLLDYNITSTQSHSILTFQQVCRAETLSLYYIVYELILITIKNFDVNQLQSKYHHLSFDFLHIHDAKILYALTQHSLYPRKGFLFLQCLCNKYRDINSKCRMITNNEYSKSYRRSETHLSKSLKKQRITDLLSLEDYDFFDFIEEHRQWCDSKNFRITHFGIHYELFDIKTIRNDILHLKLSTTRKIIGFI